MADAHAVNPAQLVAALLAVAAVAASVAVPAHAQSSYTDLHLDPIQSSAAAGDMIVLYGWLSDGDGYAVPGATVYIKDDVDFGIDGTIAALTTDEGGMFYANWTAAPRSGGGAWDLYAVFEGFGSLRSARSQTYSVTVSDLAAWPYSTRLTLDAVPAYAYEGQAVTFTGTLESGGHPVEGAAVEIKEDDPFSPDDHIAYAWTGADGRFSVVWVAEQGLVETNLEVYAEYDGDAGLYAPSTTQRYEIDVFSAPSAEATSLVLDPPPLSAYVGDMVEFTGRLTAGGHPVTGASVEIKEDDPFSPDDHIAYAWTGADGRFSVVWVAEQGLVETNLEVYAEYDGDAGLYAPSTTQRYEIDVFSAPSAEATSLVLDPPPLSAYVGDMVEFTGRLTAGGHPVTGASVEIKEDDPFSPDDHIAYAWTGADGRFSVVWVAEQGLVETNLEVYAEYDGDAGLYAPSTTQRYEIDVFSAPSAEATSLVLDPPPLSAYVGDMVEFTGRLTAGGHPVTGASVEIKEDDPFSPDDHIAYAWTGADGRFSVVWVAEQGLVETNLEVYAEYDGDAGLYAPSTTQRYEIDVFSAPSAEATSLVLDPPPLSAYVGDEVEFTGRLTAGGHPVTGASVEIKEDDPFSPDDHIAYAWTGADGRFSVVWVAEQGLVETNLEVYAEYDGDAGLYSPSTTSRHSIDVIFVPAEATSLVLDPPPLSAYVGDEVEFTGRLTAGGHPVTGASVEIKEDDPFLPDQQLGSGLTDAGGEFSVTWAVSAGLVETDFDIYAEFDGSAAYGKSQTQRYEMSVLKYGGDIRLDALPRSITEGDMVLFSGSLELEMHSPEGAKVYVMDEDPLNPDDLLATAYVEADGRFAANWFAGKVDADREADVYAVFEGNDAFYRQTTCDEGPTFEFGGLCTDTVPLYVQGAHGSPAAWDGGGPREGDAPHMDMYYALDLDGPPHVAIAPVPDSPGNAMRYVAPVQEGIMIWASAMEKKYGGEWGATFEVVEPGDLFYAERPDVVVNLVNHDEDSGCVDEYLGWAEVYEDPPRPVQTVVCTTSAKIPVSAADAAATAAHEFIHAMGLGHAFNKRGDLMCSVEDGRATCPGSSSEAGVPSDLNTGAVAKMYGTDGFASPNNPVQYKSRFYGGEAEAARAGSGDPAAASGPARAVEPLWNAGPAGGGDQASPIPGWIRTSAGWWADGAISDAEFAAGMKHLVQIGVLPAPAAAGVGGGEEAEAGIPQWVKASAGWWADGAISDAEFVRGIAYLISAGAAGP